MKKIFNILIFVLILTLSYQLYSCNLKLNIAKNNIITTSAPKIIYKENPELDKQINILSNVIDDTINMNKCDYKLTGIEVIEKRIDDLKHFNKVDKEKLIEISNEEIKQNANKK